MNLRPLASVLVAACLFGAADDASARTQRCAASASDTQSTAPKKKGPGLRGLLSAAQRAGVGELLGSGQLLGSGRTAQVASAVVGTAVEAGDGAGTARALAAAAAAHTGDVRTAQVTETVTAMAADLAGNRGATPGDEPDGACSPAPATAPAAPASVWN